MFGRKFKIEAKLLREKVAEQDFTIKQYEKQMYTEKYKISVLENYIKNFFTVDFEWVEFDCGCDPYLRFKKIKFDCDTRNIYEWRVK